MWRRGALFHPSATLAAASWPAKTHALALHLFH